MEQIKKIGRYDILYEINSGGMGTIFYGRDEDLERPVAIKMLSTELFKNFDAQLRFIQEAKIIAKLDHPNITKIYSIEYFESNAFLIMEFIKGQSLADMIDKKKSFNIDEVTSILTQLADALSYAHSKGISHLDIKPSNILIDENNKLKLTDFGISHDKNLNFNLPQNEYIGTPCYMSPEQFTDDNIDYRSDIYSFGILSYELITGHTPFRAKNHDEYKKKHLDEKPELLVEKKVKYPNTIVKFINQCLEKNKTKRPQSLEYFIKNNNNFINNDKTVNFRTNQFFSKFSIYILLSFLFIVNLFYTFKNIFFNKKKINTIEIIGNIETPSKIYSLNTSLNNIDKIYEISDTEDIKPFKIQNNPNISKKNSHIYEKLNFEQVKKLSALTPFSNEILDLSTNNKNYMKRQKALQNILWGNKKHYKSLIPFIKSDDIELVKNIAFIFGITNYTDSWSYLLDRIKHETNVEVKSQIFISIGYFNVNLFTSMKNHFLNQSFIESSSLIEMENILSGIYGEATEKTIEKVTLLIHMVEEDILKAKLFLFLTSNGNNSFFEWAKTTIIEDNAIELKIIALNILSYSRDQLILDFIQKNKRLLFKSVHLMETFLKTKIILKTFNMKNSITKYNFMEEECEKNEAVLAWLPLYLINHQKCNDKKWLKDYFNKYDNLKNYKDYILAYNIYTILYS